MNTIQYVPEVTAQFSLAVNGWIFIFAAALIVGLFYVVRHFLGRDRDG